MNGEPTEGRDSAGQPRPWTPAAAMEPIPPLAPPPARPGAGTPVFPSAREASPGARLPAVLVVVAVLLISAAAVLAVLLLHH